MANKEPKEAATVDPVVDQGATVDPVVDQGATVDPVVDQGAQASALELTAADCPYTAQGENRAKWFKGFGEADPEAE